MHQLRLLNVDDFMILRGLHEGLSVTSVGHKLGLSQPAITQRIRKMEDVFGIKFLEKEGRGVKLSHDGRRIALKALSALEIFEQEDAAPSRLEVNVGVRSDLGMQWVFPAILKMQEDYPYVRANLVPCETDKLVEKLTDGELHAAIMPSSLALLDFPALEIGVERHVMIAPAKIAEAISSIADLQGQTLVEIDKSLPSLKRFPALVREKLKFKDIWFVGASSAVLRAVEDGLGVGVVPDYLAAIPLQSGKVQMILPEIELTEEKVRLLYNRKSPAAFYFEALAKALASVT
ncbi:MAG: hypothetical protein RIQ81_229 [Pseudomonadota bacterium]|jgi:DNA-binding transcriptional LysR family regulator